MIQDEKFTLQNNILSSEVKSFSFEISEFIRLMIITISIGLHMS